MHSVTSTIENGFVYLPAEAEWLPEQSAVLNVDGTDLQKFTPRSGAVSVGTNGVRYRKPTRVLRDEKY